MVENSNSNIANTIRLIEPHGGALQCSEVVEQEKKSIPDNVDIVVSDTDLMDCEQLALGTYSPLKGFMDKETVQSVLAENHLPNGDVWTMPIVLQVDSSVAERFGVGDRIVLKRSDGFVHSFMDISEIYKLELTEFTFKWFGTDSSQHPGVERIFKSGEMFIAGDITLINRLPSQFQRYELSPTQSRAYFNQQGWRKVVGFHGRNPPHGAHKYIQLDALRRTGADGLYISPVVGPKKLNDFLSDPILNGYQMLLDDGQYPDGRVLLGSFATYSRYSGPREAVFTALCRKNMGCSHFIIGRDHTGVGEFYEPNANMALFESLGDIDIELVFYRPVGFNKKSGGFEEEQDGVALENISGTMIRETLLRRERLPDWCMPKIVQDMLIDEISSGRPVFYA